MSYASAVGNPAGKKAPVKKKATPAPKPEKKPKKKAKPYTKILKTTGKPDDSWDLASLRGYVRRKKLNKPEIKISMKKADLVKGLKKHGHWKS
tara:strand:- start:254 stop:532 length:279 start_codon:yes stop_codon:yes gene_type:complete